MKITKQDLRRRQNYMECEPNQLGSLHGGSVSHSPNVAEAACDMGADEFNHEGNE